MEKEILQSIETKQRRKRKDMLQHHIEIKKHSEEKGEREREKERRRTKKYYSSFSNIMNYLKFLEITRSMIYFVFSFINSKNDFRIFH